MTFEIKHATQVDPVEHPNDPSVPVGTDAWNAALAATMATARVLGRVTSGAGGVEELTASDLRALINVANGATANDTDANLKNRANHTGTQTASTISDFSTTADARISAAVGTSVQAYSAKLAALAGQTWAADRYTYYTSTSAVAIGTLTTFGRSLIDDADAAAARTTLGLGSLATLSAVNNGNWSGTALSLANGGTGQTTAANAFNAIKQAATQTATGVVELATDAEMTTGTATGVIPDVKQVADYVAANSSGGIYSVGSVVSLSNDAAASFTLSTTAEEIEFRLQNVIPVSDSAAQLLMFASIDNGANYNVPLRGLWVSRSSSTSGSNVSPTTTGFNFDLGGVGSDTNEYGVTMEMTVARRAGNYQTITFSITSTDGSGAMTFRVGSIEVQTTTLLTNIRFQFSNTNMESGRIIAINLEAA
jgi:hypothetical protein